MKAIEEAADIAAELVPAARTSRALAYAIAAVAAVAIAGAIFWWFFIHPRQLAADAAQSKVDGVLGTAAANIAAEAIPQINEAARQKAAIDDLVLKGEADVRAASDAGTSIGGVSDAVRRSDCVSGAYPDDPACLALHEDPAGLGPARSDPGGAAQPD